MIKRILGILLLCCLAMPAMAQRLGPFNYTANSQCHSINTSSIASGTVVIDVGGTFSLTLTAYTIVAGQAPRAVEVTPGSAVGTPQSTMTAVGDYWAPAAGVDQVEVCTTAYTSGSAVVYMNASEKGASLFGGGGGGGGGTVPTITGGVQGEPVVGASTTALANAIAPLHCSQFTAGTTAAQNTRACIAAAATNGGDVIMDFTGNQVIDEQIFNGSTFRGTVHVLPTATYWCTNAPCIVVPPGATLDLGQGPGQANQTAGKAHIVACNNLLNPVTSCGTTTLYNEILVCFGNGIVCDTSTATIRQGARVTGGLIDCNNTWGCIGGWNVSAQENSGFFQTQVINWANHGAGIIEGDGLGSGTQNSTLAGLNVTNNGAAGDCTNSACTCQPDSAGIIIDAAGGVGPREISDISVTSGSTTNQSAHSAFYPSNLKSCNTAANKPADAIEIGSLTGSGDALHVENGYRAGVNFSQVKELINAPGTSPFTVGAGGIVCNTGTGNCVVTVANTGNLAQGNAVTFASNTCASNTLNGNFFDITAVTANVSFTFAPAPIGSGATTETCGGGTFTPIGFVDVANVGAGWTLINTTGSGTASTADLIRINTGTYGVVLSDTSSQLNTVTNTIHDLINSVTITQAAHPNVATYITGDSGQVILDSSGTASPAMNIGSLSIPNSSTSAVSAIFNNPSGTSVDIADFDVNSVVLASVDKSGDISGVKGTFTGALSGGSFANTAHVLEGPLQCADTSSSSTTYTCTVPNSYAAYTAGDCFILSAINQNNSGASTLNVNTIGAKSLVKWQGTALASGDLKAASSQMACYDGTNIEISSIGNAPAGGVSSVNTLTGAVVIENATAGQMAVSGGNGAALTGAADMTYSTHTFATLTTGIFDWSAATGVASLKFPAVAGGTVLTGTVTAALTAPVVFQNTNSSGNNNSSMAAIFTTPGTSTGQVTAYFNGATTGAALIKAGTGGTVASGAISGQTDVFVVTPTGSIQTGTPPTVTTPGSGFYIFGTDGTEPASIGAGTSGFNMDSTANCPIQYNNGANVGCSAALSAVETFATAQTFAGGVINTTTPIRDQTHFVLVAAMTAVSTAGVNIGSTGASNVTFSWPVTAANWYDMKCDFPVTFVTSATIAFELVSISGSSTISFANTRTIGDTGAAAIPQDLSKIGATTLATSVTPTTGAPGNVNEMISYNAQFLSSHAGNIGLEFIGNGTNNVQMLEGGQCGLTQIN